MKSIVINVLKVFVILLIVVWMIFFVVDYFRAKDGLKPIVCFSEVSKSNSTGSYYRCTSLGYKYYESKDTVSGQTMYGFGAMFIKSETEKVWED